METIDVPGWALEERHDDPDVVTERDIIDTIYLYCEECGDGPINGELMIQCNDGAWICQSCENYDPYADQRWYEAHLREFLG